MKDVRTWIGMAVVGLAGCSAPCASDPPPEIVGDVSVTVTSSTAAIEWSTDEPSTTHVDYGMSTAYSSQYGDDAPVSAHRAVIDGLAAGTTYNFRVRSVDECGHEATSPNATFTTDAEDLIAPPVLVDEPDAIGPVPAEVVLEWSEVAAPGGSAQYMVEVDALGTFASPEGSSGWIDGREWTVSLGGGMHYWRAMARDAADTSIVSAWSAVDSFRVASSHAPPAPVLVDEPDTMSGGLSYDVTLEWSGVTDPDGDPVEYAGQLGYFADFSSVSFESGWIGATSWTVTVPPGGMWYWRVKARDATHVDAESDWSEVDTFYDMTMPGSCPFLFVWDGEGYRYLTDIQGPAIGLPPSVLTIRNMRHYHPEYVVLDGIAERNGTYEVKIRETQGEITYLDEEKLLVVDCPGGRGVVSSTAESTYSFGYSEPFEVVSVGPGRPPVDARDPEGASVLDALLEVDSRSVGKDRRYVVDFGKVEGGHARLLIDGWSVYDRDAYPSKVLVQPFVEVRRKGKWVKARSFGNPAGDLKRMVVDLSGMIGDGRIRIDMGRIHAIRWMIDRIALDTSEPVTCQVTTIEASRALLYHGGRVPYARANLSHPNVALDECLPDNVEAYSYGSFTRYGDILDLLGASDDMYAILRHGDEALVTFPGVEPPAAGMTRSFILGSRLWYKHLSIADTVEPLPYIGMTTYPLEGYPSDEAHAATLETYNVRRYVR